MNTNKVIEYSGQLAVLITETIQENSEFDIEDINENITEFITALCVIVPHKFLKLYTDEKIVNYLDSNHLANSLCVQFMQEMRDQYPSKDGEGHEQE